jgi:fatty acid photodecarboxylase
VAKEKGMSTNPDFNDWSRPQEGFGTFQVTQHRGERADTSRQYLSPALDRPNLTVLTGAHTTKVVTEKTSQGPRAVGVEFVRQSVSGRTRHSAQVSFSGEVILAAGAVHSPHILQLSGIGDGPELTRHGVHVVKDLPHVGRNLQDHPAVVVSMLSAQSGVSVTDEIYHADGSLKKRAILNWLIRRRGPLTTTGCDRGAFLKTSSGHSQPDLQLRFVPALALDPDGVSSYSIFGVLKEKGLSYPSGWSFQLIACRPKSRGSVSLRSADPFDSPLLDAGFLTDPGQEDLTTLRAGMRLVRDLSSSPTFAPVNGGELHPGPRAQSDGEVDAYIRKTLHSANAVVGTCAMGTHEGSSVVDAHLRVHGVRGLRVVDASVIPVIPGGQTGAPTVMIAERAADLLLGKATV